MEANGNVRNYTTVEMPKDVHKSLKEVALQQNKSVKALLIEIVMEFVNKEKEVA
jgi:predicted HicB family RNase H-like nuclease